MTQSLMSANVSPRFGLPFLYPAQAQKEFFINQGTMLSDILLHASVEGVIEALPTSANGGEAWLISAIAAGDLAEKRGWIAANIAPSGAAEWQYISPQKGMRFYDKAAGQFLLYTDQWVRPASLAKLAGAAGSEGQIRTAINAILDILGDAGMISKA